MRISALLILLLASLNFQAQSSSLRLLSSDSIPVYVFIGGAQINSEASTDIKSTNLNPGKLPLDILSNDSITELNFNVLLKPGFHHTYELMKIGKEFQLLPLSATVIEQQLPNPTESENQGIAPLTTDSIPADSLPGYSGPVGCRGTCSEASVDLLIKAMSEMYFEKEKYNAASAFIRSNCLLTKQLAKILNHIDLEDRKLQLALMSIDYIYDIGHYLQLKDEFGLAASRAKLENSFNSRSSLQN